MNQKGSLPILILIGLTIIGVTATVVFFFKDTFLASMGIGKAAREQEINVQPNSTVIESSNTQSSLTGKILFVSQENKLMISNINGENSEPFNKEFDQLYDTVGADASAYNISPDRKKLLLYNYRKPKEKTSLENIKVVPIMLDLESRTFKEIDVSKLSDSVGINGPFLNWLTAQKLLYTFSDRPDSLPGTIKRSIGTYEIETGEFKEIYSEEEYKTEFYPAILWGIYYNPETEMLSYIDENTKTIEESWDIERPKGVLINLKTKHKTVFKEPHTINKGSRVYGEYTITSNSLIDPYKRTELLINRFDNPSEPIAKVSIAGISGASFSNYIDWSPNYRLFATEVNGAQKDSEEKIKKTRADQTNQIFIYTKEGELLSRTDMPALGGIPGVGSIFSEDSKKVLTYGSLIDEPKHGEKYKILWRIYDIEGKETPIDIKSYNTGRPVFWYK